MAPVLTLARECIAALEAGVIGDALARFFDADVVQREFPNRLTRRSATRDLAALLAGAERGQRVMAAQRFEIVNAMETERQVALETRWRGTLTVPLGSLVQRVHADVLGGERAGYGGEVIETLGQHVTAEFGRGFSGRSLHRMVQFAGTFPGESIVYALSRQLSWTHFR